MIRNKQIVITGGAGFIGSSLALALAPENRVRVLDATFEGTPFSTISGVANIEPAVCDVLDYEALRGGFEGAHLVLHLAAVVGVDRVRQSARRTIEVNFGGTQNALRAAKETRGLERFLYFSTGEIFGSNSFRVQESALAQIGSVTEARWSYASSKLVGEHLVMAYHREFGLPTSTVRPFNVFGPRRLGDHVMLRFIAAALADEPLVVHGDGSQIRSWCYIDDFCQGALRILATPAAVGEDFNIGSGQNAISIFHLAERVIEATGSKSKITFAHPGFEDIDVRVPTLEKARRLLGYEPQFGLDEGIRRTVRWCRENQHLLPQALAPSAQARAAAAALQQ